MPKRRYLRLSESERAELEQVLRRDQRAYMRERASALIQIADGRSSHWVSQHGLLRRRNPKTVIAWLNAYEQGGVAALVQKPRRKRDFPP
jgi:transposase